MVFELRQREPRLDRHSDFWRVDNLTLSWSYDSFGNRKTQTPSGQNIMAPVPQAQTLSYPSQKPHQQLWHQRIRRRGQCASNDQINNYLYDPEGRLCAVSYFDGMTTRYMLYLYDGEGRRVAKVFPTRRSAVPRQARAPRCRRPTCSALRASTSRNWDRPGHSCGATSMPTGQLLATYTNNGTYFSLNDWLEATRGRQV